MKRDKDICSIIVNRAFRDQLLKLKTLIILFRTIAIVFSISLSLILLSNHRLSFGKVRLYFYKKKKY